MSDAVTTYWESLGVSSLAPVVFPIVGITAAEAAAPTLLDLLSSAWSQFSGSPISVTGVVSQGQKNALVQDETASLIAGGMEPSQAAANAQADVTGQLQAAGADPSQFWQTNVGEVLKWILIVLTIYLVVEVVILGKEAGLF